MNSKYYKNRSTRIVDPETDQEFGGAIRTYVICLYVTALSEVFAGCFIAFLYLFSESSFSIKWALISALIGVSSAIATLVIAELLQAVTHVVRSLFIIRKQLIVISEQLAAEE